MDIDGRIEVCLESPTGDVIHRTTIPSYLRPDVLQFGTRVFVLRHTPESALVGGFAPNRPVHFREAKTFALSPGCLRCSNHGLVEGCPSCGKVLANNDALADGA